MFPLGKAPVVASYAVLYVAGNGATPASGDSDVFDWLDAKTSVTTLTTIDDGDAEQDSTDGWDIVVLGPFATGNGARYQGDGTNPIPVLDLIRNGAALKHGHTGTNFPFTDDVYYSSAAEVTWTGQSTGGDVVCFNASASHNSDSGPVTTYTDATVMCTETSTGTFASVWTFEAGDTMESAVVTSVRVGCAPLYRAATAGINAAGTQLLDDLFDWVVGAT